MAYRAIFTKILEKSNIRPLMLRNNPTLMRTQPKSSIRPAQRLVESPSMFSPVILKKYYELIPLAVIIAGAMAGLAFAIVRNAMTRDDVRFSTHSKMLCEKPEDSPRKFLVYNQKYETPKGLNEALAALEEPKKE